MLQKERTQEILGILKSKEGFVTVKELCEKLFASQSSIRRDLKELEEGGLVKRSYGGACLVAGFSAVVTFNHRTGQNVKEKREIARKAADLIGDGEVIFLDQSSTAFFLAEEIGHRKHLTVVTNNIEIMMLLSPTGVKVISSGGYLSEENRNCLVGSAAEKTFDGIFADWTFFSVHSLTDDGVVTDCQGEEIAVRSAMLRNAARKVLLCDSSKFSGKAPFKQCLLSEVDLLISEGDAAKKFSSFGNKVKLL